MNGQYNVGDIVLHNWTLTEQLGEGSYGSVYKAVKRDIAGEYVAAIKIISIPKTQEEVRAAFSEGMTESSVSHYFRSVVDDMSREFRLMAELKGESVIVSYEDHDLVPHTDGIGWDIIIRMELLTPFSRILDEKKKLSETEIICLGTDLCHALELCRKYNIIHRDIKPANIFKSLNGHFKLGDFGVARTIDKTIGNATKAGTYNYMAPEVYREEPYGSSVDIYSLGIVLYQLLNDNRGPFLPPFPDQITKADRDIALSKRMSGEKMPFPANNRGRLAEIALKACSYDQQDRYSTPTEMREALEKLLNGEETVTKPHIHRWKEATCTEPKTCVLCSATVGEPLGHKWQEATFDMPRICSRCGLTDGEPLSRSYPRKKILAIIVALAVVSVIGFWILRRPVLLRQPSPTPVLTPTPIPSSSLPQMPVPTPVQEIISKPTPALAPVPSQMPTLTPTPSPTPTPTPTPSPTPASTPMLASDADDYAHAVSLLEAGKYEEAEIAFESLGDYKDSAEKLAETQYYIGLEYETGSMGMKNEALAASYYQLSANGGHLAGINKLGECYYNGVGKTQDYNKAFELFEEASDLGCVEADYNLGLCYENGHGVKQNKALAEAYFNIASKNNTGNS